jgi:hypothetical protein
MSTKLVDCATIPFDTRKGKKKRPKTENEPKTFKKLYPPRVCGGGVVLRILQGTK